MTTDDVKEQEPQEVLDAPQPLPSSALLKSANSDVASISVVSPDEVSSYRPTGSGKSLPGLKDVQKIFVTSGRFMEINREQIERVKLSKCNSYVP